jgi:hypothetical protein
VILRHLQGISGILVSKTILSPSLSVILLDEKVNFSNFPDFYSACLILIFTSLSSAENTGASLIVFTSIFGYSYSIYFSL